MQQKYSELNVLLEQIYADLDTYKKRAKPHKKTRSIFWLRSLRFCSIFTSFSYFFWELIIIFYCTFWSQDPSSLPSSSTVQTNTDYIHCQILQLGFFILKWRIFLK